MPQQPIIVPGRAISVRARAARRYKQCIHNIAKPLFPVPLTSRTIRVQVAYFYTTGHVVDLDNLLKCVLDGLTGAAYEDDSQVEEIWIRRYNILEDHRIPTIEEALYRYIAQREPFVSIEVSESEDLQQ